MIDVTAQPWEALLLFHGGAVTGMLYLLLRLVRTGRGRAVTHLTDAVFVLLLGAILAGYLFLANYGTVRAFLLIAFALGFAATYGLFSPLFARMSQKIRKK